MKLKDNDKVVYNVKIQRPANQTVLTNAIEAQISKQNSIVM